MSTFEKFYNKRPVLVTGGAGFIGSSVVERLVNAGATVTILDDFSSGTMDNLSHIQHKIKIIVGDIIDKKICFLATRNQTHIFHLAARISVQESAEKKALYDQVNVFGTRNLLEAAILNNVKKFIFSSSAAVYGNKQTKCSENLSLKPESFYAETKKRGEELCQNLSAKSDLITVSLRYFNVDGSRKKTASNYNSVIPIFIKKLREKLPITIFGDGLQTRDFVDIDEIVSANLMAGFFPYKRSEIINVASGKSTTILELIDQIAKRLQLQKTPIIFMPQRNGDVLKSEADCQKYMSLKKNCDNTL
jgi:UDP-glucose 4-epimerase